MQTTETLLGLLRERGKRGLPLNRIYRQLYNTNLYLSAYGRIYRNAGAMTPGLAVGRRIFNAATTSSASAATSTSPRC